MMDVRKNLRRSAASEPRDFNLALNGFRGLCALSVFVFHLNAAGVAELNASQAQFIATSLAFGVEMFFMISGFVILGSLLRHGSIGAFLRDRVIRIFSAWVPAIVAVTLVGVVFQMEMFAGRSALETLGLFAANLLLLPPIAPLPLIHYVSWSLTYEWIFYLTAAGGLSLLRMQRRRWAVRLWVIAAAMIVCLLPPTLFFITGVLVYRHRAWFAERRAWLRFPLVSLIVFLIAWRLTEGPSGASGSLLDWIRDGRIAPALIAFAASIHLFASICLNANREFRFLNGRTFQFLGAISYSFYLWHTLVMGLVKRVIGVLPVQNDVIAFALFAALSIAITLPLAWASWRLFEVRGGKWLRKVFAARPALGSAIRAT